MFRTPANKTSAYDEEADHEVRAGSSPKEGTNRRDSLVDIAETLEDITAEQHEPKTPPITKQPGVKDETPKRQGPLPRPKLPQKTYTVTKKNNTVETPSPIKSPRSAKEAYPTKMVEARTVYKKGIENLERFKNLKASVKLEIRKALDRLYALVNDGPAVRNLGKEIDKDTPPPPTETKRFEMNHINSLERRLEEHATLLKQNTKAMEDLKISINKTEDLQSILTQHKETLEKASYASVAAAKTTAVNNMVRPTLHSVIVSSENEQNTGEEVLEEVRKAINAKEGWIRVEKVRKAKDRKVVVGCATVEERRKIKKRLEETGHHLIVEEVKNRDPMLVVKDVLSKHTDEEFIRALKNQNRDIFQSLDKEDERIQIKFRKRARNPHTCHIVITVSPTIWGRTLDTGRIRVDLQKLYVEDQSPLIQCSRCLGYGHGRRFCKESEDLCSHCGGPHLSAKCPDRVVGEEPDCVNCKKAKIEKRNHNAFSRDCAIRKKWDLIARASVSYC